MGKIMVLIFEDPQDEFIKNILDLIGEDQHDFTLIEPTLIMSFEGLEIRTAERRVILNGNEVRLTNIELSVLIYLAKHPGWVQSRRQIYNGVWPLEAETELHAVESAISTLRKKIDPNLKQPRYIETVSGHGYRFIGIPL